MCRRPVTLGGGSSMVNFFVASCVSLGVGTSNRCSLDPVLGPAFFNDRRIVCFWQFVAHRYFKGSIGWAIASFRLRDKAVAE